MLALEFIVDKTSQSVLVHKMYDAELSLVWDAFTKQEILDQWWAPKPWTSKTKHMDFKPGGSRFYAMISPEGDARWQIQQYSSISPKTSFKYTSLFTDKDANPEPQGSDWEFRFTEVGAATKLSICIKNDSLPRMEKMLEMGFKEGFTMILNELSSVLEQLKNKQP